MTDVSNTTTIPLPIRPVAWRHFDLTTIARDEGVPVTTVIMAINEGPQIITINPTCDHCGDTGEVWDDNLFVGDCTRCDAAL